MRNTYNVICQRNQRTSDYVRSTDFNIYNHREVLQSRHFILLKRWTFCSIYLNMQSNYITMFIFRNEKIHLFSKDNFYSIFGRRFWFNQIEINQWIPLGFLHALFTSSIFQRIFFLQLIESMSICVYLYLYLQNESINYELISFVINKRNFYEKITDNGKWPNIQNVNITIHFEIYSWKINAIQANEWNVDKNYSKAALNPSIFGWWSINMSIW